MPQRKKPVRRKKAAPSSRGLTTAEILETTGPEFDRLSSAVERDGGAVIGRYNDPLGGKPLLVAALPVEMVEPTPYQRDPSDAHVKRLMGVMETLGRFLDPIVVVRHNDRYWTPNGNHRLQALKKLGVRTIVALLVPEADVAFKILALNTEKAHNLRERSLEVIRIYRGLLEEDAARPEQGFAFYLEEASLITMGICYERNGRFAGGSYNPVVRRLLEFSDKSLRTSLPLHEARADKLFELDKHVAVAIDKLKERGLVSPYLRAFVVARINPLRFMQGDLPSLDSVLKTMTERAQKFNVEKIKQSDLASAGGVPDNAET
jgi:ParB family chromosome partitioning protein